MRPIQRATAVIWLVSLIGMVLFLWSRFPTNLGAGEDAQVRILYSGDTAGYLEPCG